MTIQVNIIKTTRGYNYRNAESGKLLGTVNEGRNKPGIFFWELPCDYGFATEEKAHEELKHALTQRAENLGVEITFTNYNF